MSKEQFEWSITDHACRVCLGRVLTRKAFDGRKLYRCACCGLERDGTGTQALCCCGIKLRPGHGPMDAGVRCVPNPGRSPENLAEIVAVQVSAPKAEAALRAG